MKKLYFVYNATSGVWSKSLDIAHKIISPSAYSCSLCSLTHGNFSEKKIWKNFRENTNAELVFLYKNDFLKLYPEFGTIDFPVVLQKKQTGFELVLSAEELASFSSVEDLIKEVKNRI